MFAFVSVAIFASSTFTNAAETLWECRDAHIQNVTAKGDYFAMNSSDMMIEDLKLVGNYPFDGARNITVRNSRLISKDAFWTARSKACKGSAMLKIS